MIPRFWVGLQPGSALLQQGVLGSLLAELGRGGARIGVETAPFDGTDAIDRALVEGIRESGIPREQLYVTRLVGVVDGDAARIAAVTSQFGPSSVTPVDEGTCSCLDAAYFEREAAAALGCLGSPLDALVVVNPEDYLVGRMNRPGRAGPESEADRRDGWRSELQELLRGGFAALNRLAADGSIGGFGVSSEGLEASERIGPASLHPNLVSAAAAAAASDTGSRGLGAMRLLAFPGNLVERRSWRAMSEWGRQRDLSVLLTRPLTARDPTGAPLPLDDTEWGSAGDGYDEIWAEARDWFVVPDDWPEDFPEEDRKEVAEAVGFVSGLLERLHDSLGEYTSPLHWEKDLATQVAPMVRERLAEVDETSAGLIARFLDAYGRRVRTECQAKTRSVVASAPADGGLGYGSSPGPWPGLSIGSDEGLRSFAHRWCRAVVDGNAADGVILHASSAEEARRMRDALLEN